MKKRTLNQKKRILQDLNMARQQAGMPKLEGGSRICLKCGRSFFSMGKWNRICESCSIIISKREESLETYHIGR